MRNFITVLSIIVMLFAVSLKSHATHVVGGEIYYECISPGVYVATCKLYFVVSSGVPMKPTIQFNLRSPGCNTGTIITGNHQSQTSHNINGSAGNSCFSGGSIWVSTYKATFTLSSAQQQCQDWYLSVRECPKSPAGNMQNTFGTCLYIETYINAAVANLQKSSPEFVFSESWIFPLNSPATYSNFAIQKSADPDSLVYTIKPAMDDHNVPSVYTSNTSYSQPILSSSAVTLHPYTGTLTFNPNGFNGTLINANQFSVVVEVAAYRKVNGVITKVSASQRNLPVIVVNVPNNNPEIINATANGQTIAPNSIIQIQAGSNLNFQFGTADANAGDSLVILPFPSGFTGFSISSTGGFRPAGTISWQAPLSTQNQQIIYFPVTILDKVCPGQGVTTQVYGIKVLANPMGLKDKLHLGADFQIYPNPFSKEVNFKFEHNSKTQTILIYNLLGQQIDEIQLEMVGLGEQKVQWQNAHKHAAGTYVARLVSRDKTIQTLKFTKLQ